MKNKDGSNQETARVSTRKNTKLTQEDWKYLRCVQNEKSLLLHAYELENLTHVK